MRSYDPAGETTDWIHLRSGAGAHDAAGKRQGDVGGGSNGLDGGFRGLERGGGTRSTDDEIAAGNAESSAIGRLLVVVENYPQLKSDATFMRLMDELAGTENRISTTRMRYNEQVQAYNTLRNQFPSNLTGKLFGFKAEYPFFAAPEDAKASPKVDFNKK